MGEEVEDDATMKNEQEIFQGNGTVLYPGCEGSYTNIYVLKFIDLTKRLILWYDHFLK